MTIAELADQVKIWQERLEQLGIKHWRVKVEWGGLDENDLAEVKANDFYDSATIHFDKKSFTKGTKKSRDETIVHELLHVAWRDLDAATQAIPDFWNHSDRVRHEKEGLIERLARLIVTIYEK